MKLAMMTVMLLAISVGGCASPDNGGATGAAPQRYMGVSPNVNGTWNGATTSSTMVMQRIKQDNARRAISGGANIQY